MSTHLHLAILLRLMLLGDLFESVHTAFAAWFRAAHGGLGGVFAGRFKSIVFEPELAAWLLAYIHNNEGRAGLVSDPAQSHWSSHKFYRGEVRAPSWLHVGVGLELSGNDETLAGRRNFDAWVRSRAADPRLETFGRDADTGDRYAELADHGVSIVPAGSACSWTPPSVERRARPWSGSPSTALNVAATLFGVTEAEVRSSLRYDPLPSVRSTVLLAWARDLGRSLAELAAAMNLTSGAASRACGRARRDQTLSKCAVEIARVCRGEANVQGSSAA
jgi:hypothetical protein